MLDCTFPSGWTTLCTAKVGRFWLRTGLHGWAFRVPRRKKQELEAQEKAAEEAKIALEADEERQRFGFYEKYILSDFLRFSLARETDELKKLSNLLKLQFSND